MNGPRNQRQLQLLRYVYGYIVAHDGIAPSVEECRQALGARSKGYVYRLLVALEDRALIRRLRGKDRAIEVLQAPVIPTIAGAPLYAVALPRQEA